MVRLVSLTVLLTLIIILGLTFFQVLAPFLLPLFLAGVFTVLVQPLFKRFVERTGGRSRLAAALTTAAVITGILGPVVLITVLSSLQMFVVATRLTDRNWTKTVRENTEAPLEYIADFLNSRLNQPLNSKDTTIETTVTVEESASPPTDDHASEPAPPVDVDPAPSDAADDAAVPTPTFTPEGIRARIAERSRIALQDLARRSLGAGTFDFLSSSVVTLVSVIVSFLVFVIALYYFLADGPLLLSATERLIPVHVQYQKAVFEQFAKVVRSVVMATLFAAVVQAVATTAALWVLGFNHLLVLLALCVLTAMIPMLGTWLIWGSCAVWLVWNGRWAEAVGLSIYGIVVVGVLDNLVRTYVLNSSAKLHPLLALISVLGGLKTMGLWGIFIGPIVASCLHALVQIFNLELSLLSQERLALKENDARPPDLLAELMAGPSVAATPEETAAASTTETPAPSHARRPRVRKRRRK